MNVGGTEKSWAKLEQAGLVYSQCTQPHDAHICKVKKFETNFVARLVKCKKKKTRCQFEGMKLDHRNYLDLNEDLSSGIPTMQDSNERTQLQRLARMLKYSV